ncbi:MAG: di-heme oxidoredictase family protein [Acidobacteriaceae bacterium]
MIALMALSLGCPWVGKMVAQSAEPASDASFMQYHKAQLPSNATSCAGCHAVPMAGGSSRVTVTQAGRNIAGHYVGIGLDGTLHTFGETSIDTAGLITGQRVALNILGEGYVEAVPGQELRDIAKAQIKQTHGRVHGEPTLVTLPECNVETKAVGRFGWKAQHASLLSASADALRSELGVPNPFFPANVATSSIPIEEQLDVRMRELDAMVRFLRSTEPVAPDPERSATESAQEGSKIFDRIGCSICHVRTLRTAPAGTKLDGGILTVSARLANKEIHPYSDYLLHDVGTGDGIVQNIRPQDYDEKTANKFRTAPLWGVRYRSWLMHDGKSITYHQAIMRHAGEATDSVRQYMRLTPIQKQDLRLFLNSL